MNSGSAQQKTSASYDDKMPATAAMASHGRKADNVKL